MMDLGGIFGFFLVDLELEAEAVERAAGSRGPTSDLSGPMVAEAVVWRFGFVAARWWVRVLLSYVVWLLSFCVFRLSKSNSFGPWGTYYFPT